MSNSLNQLKDLLNGKGGASSAQTTSFQDLKALYDALGVARTVTKSADADVGQEYSGVACAGHNPAKFPYTGGLSYGQINEKLSDIVPLKHGNTAFPTAYCVSRSSDCEGRTACVCHNQSGNKSATCDCEFRIFGCPCINRCNCHGRTACNCHGRTTCVCNSRCSCNAETLYSV